MQAYFGRAKAACLCSYCCNRHLCYDGGRLGRVKIVTLRVGARAKEAKRGGGGEKNTPLLLTRPIFSPLFEFQHALSRANHSRARRKRLHCRLSQIERFQLTWPTSMLIYWNKTKFLHKKRFQLPQDWFGTPTWPPFHCFGTLIWPPWRHVKTLYILGPVYKTWRTVFVISYASETKQQQQKTYDVIKLKKGVSRDTATAEAN